MPIVPSRPRAWIYIRESKVELLDGYSPAEMVDACREKVARLGADVEREIVEEGKRDELDCPGLLETIEAAKDGALDLIVSYDMMRLTGDLGKHIWFKGEIGKTNAAVHYVTAEYAATPEGDLQETIQGAFGRYERLKIRVRTLNGINGKLKRRQPMCNGRTPYGLEKVYDDRKKPIGWKTKEPEFGILRGIVRDLETRPLQQVCDELNAAGTPTPSGTGEWRTGTISSLLANKVYRGDYAFGERKKIIGRRPDGKRTSRMEWRAEDDPSITRFSFEPFIPLDALRAAEQAIARRKLERRPHYADEDDPYTLRGRLVCGYGHGRLHAVPTNGVRYYVCSQAFGRYAPKDKSQRCRLPVVPAAGIEALAWSEFLAATREPGRVEAALRAVADPGGRAERHRRQAASITAEIDKLTERIVNGADILREFGRESTTWAHTKRAMAIDEQTKAELVESLAQLEAHAPVVMTEEDIAGLLEAWADLAAGIDAAGESPSEQRAVYGLLRLQGTVVLDAGGIRLGQKHQFGADWAWGGKLVSSGKHPCGILLLHTSQRGVAVLADADPDAVSWLASHPTSVSSSAARVLCPSATR